MADMRNCIQLELEISLYVPASAAAANTATATTTATATAKARARENENENEPETDVHAIPTSTLHYTRPRSPQDTHSSVHRHTYQLYIHIYSWETGVQGHRRLHNTDSQ